MNENDAGPAFPSFDNCEKKGMSLRDYFAAAAMQAIISLGPRDQYEVDNISEVAYERADSMLKEREK